MSNNGRVSEGQIGPAAGPERAADAAQAWALAALAPVFTREELVERLNRSHVPMTERQIRSWASYGIIPPPTRKAPADSSDGRARALYPRWMFNALFGLHIMLEEGATIAELKERAPGFLRRVQEEYLASSLFVRLDDGGAPVALVTPRLPLGLQRALWSYAERYVAQAKMPVRGMTLTLHDDVGRDIAIPVPVPPPIEEKGRYPEVFLTKDPDEG